MSEKIVLYQHESYEGQSIKHNLCLETYICIAISMILAIGILFCAVLCIDGVDSWDTRTVLFVGMSTFLMLGIVVLHIAGIVETIRTDILITTVSLMGKTVIIDYVIGRKKYSKEIPCNHINSNVGPIRVYSGLNIYSYGISITNYGFIELQQRIKNNQVEKKEIEKIHEAIKKIRYSS